MPEITIGARTIPYEVRRSPRANPQADRGDPGGVYA